MSAKNTHEAKAVRRAEREAAQKAVAREVPRSMQTRFSKRWKRKMERRAFLESLPMVVPGDPTPTDTGTRDHLRSNWEVV